MSERAGCAVDDGRTVSVSAASFGEGHAVALDDEISAYWDERATSYSNGVRGELGDERGDGWRDVLADALGRLRTGGEPDGPRLRALDLGCGPGFFTILLTGLGCAVDAVDGSDEMLAHARENLAARKAAEPDSPWGPATFTQHDVTRLPFADNTFDIAVSRNVTWLMLEPEAAYAEWLRVLRPGGRLLVFDANWYRYLIDPVIDAQRHADQDGSVLEGWDDDAQATSDEERRCEIIAEGLPLTPVLRPAWDLEVLSRLGASRVRADERVWERLWTPSEQAYYGSSPMFLVEAVK